MQNYKKYVTNTLWTVLAILFIVISLCPCVNGWTTDYVVSESNSGHNFFAPKFVFVQERHRREAVAADATSTTVVGTVTMKSPVISANLTITSNPPSNSDVPPLRTTPVDVSYNANLQPSSSIVPPTVVTKTSSLLGVNGSGQYHGDVPNNLPKVSEPIIPDDDIVGIFDKASEKIDEGQSNMQYDNHTFYNSIFIDNHTYFDDHWANITKYNGNISSVLSHSYRRATTSKLNFDFPFYGHMLREITVTTGGFVYTGDHVHNWIAATQYIAPLMANFDNTIHNGTYVKLYDYGDMFTVLWENVTLQEAKDKNFTFAMTLYKNGDIVFAYKDIPLRINSIIDTEHPVKVGISDAYLHDKISFYVRRQTIYEYHRVSFTTYEISNHTILKLLALPTCLQYDSCMSCVNHNTGFDCSWCENIKKCSSGTDRNKQDWLLRDCEKTNITNESKCPESPTDKLPKNESVAKNTTESNNTNHATIIEPARHKINTTNKSSEETLRAAAVVQESHSPIGTILAVFIVLGLIGSVAGWILYAFKNPHTRSGQFLIKYRPSQWTWRRGEARYTAATIHM